jgi:PAS domain S-box-containing protein
MVRMHPADTPESLREQQRHELLQAGLDLLDQGITVFDADLRLVAWNQALLRLLEFPENLTYVGAPFDSFMRYNAERGEYGPGDVDALVAERVGMARTFQPHRTERERPNGQILSVRGEPLPHHGFITLYTDITAQRRYERMIREQNAELERRVAQRTAEQQTSNRQLRSAHEANQQITAALRRSEERLRLITDTVPAMIGYFDRDEVYRYVNKGYADWFGHSKSRVLGRTIAEVVSPEVYAAVSPHVALALQGQRVTYEYATTGATGRSMHARSELVPEVGPDGEVLGCFVLSVDITQLRDAQAAVVQAQKMEAVVQLTGGLAHDFNNMLAVMIGNLAALRDRHPDDPDTAEFLMPALKASHSGAELIRRLLTFARKQPLAPQPVDVAELIDDAVHLLRRSLPDAVQVVVVPPESGAPTLALTDAHQLESALVNLAINARDAMPEGGELRIEARPVHLGRLAAAAIDVSPGDYVRITVTDTGIGMDAATQARVFEPFFTTKRFGSGSGLGLSMVYGFAKQSGGGVILHSRLGEGTQVSLLLPQTGQPSHDTELSDEPSAPLNPASLPGPATALTDRPLVLLVEDNDELRRVIRRQLVGLGYPVIEAAHAEEALDLLQNVPDIGLLISDIVMPGRLDGRALSRQARLSHPDMHILLISGYADEMNLPTHGDMPRLLRKPFSSRELGDALDQLDTP